MNRREEAIDRLDEVLFADELHLAAFRAMVSASTLRDAVDAAGPAVASLLQRLAVEETSAEVDDVVSLLVQRAGRRALDQLQARARRSDSEALELASTVAWLKLALEQLPEPEATDRLLAWLVQWGEG